MKSAQKKSRKPRSVEDEPYDSGWRLFLSLPVPEEVKVLMSGITSYVDGEKWPVRWTNTELAHITLHFLGDTEPERAELLRSALPGLVANRAPFTLQTGQVGVFPHAQEPRVLWLGLAGQIKSLAELHADTTALLRSLDFPIENKQLRPHLTLGRARDHLPPDFSQLIQEKFLTAGLQERLSRNSISFPVSEITLMRSYLGKGGAKHVPVVTSNFAGG